MKRSPGRLICRIIAHKWAPVVDADGRVCRFCIRCAEVQWHR